MDDRPRTTDHLTAKLSYRSIIVNPKKQKRLAGLQAFVPRAGVEPARV